MRGFVWCFWIAGVGVSLALGTADEAWSQRRQAPRQRRLDRQPTTPATG